MGLMVAIVASAVLVGAGCGDDRRPGGSRVTAPDASQLEGGPWDAGPAAEAPRDAAVDAGLEEIGPDAAAPDAGSPDAATLDPVDCEPGDEDTLVAEAGRLLGAHAAAVPGGFVVAYSVREDDLDVLRATLLDPCGGVVAQSLPIDETGRYVNGARAVGLEAGFVVAWTRTDGDGTDDGVVFRRFDDEGRGRGEVTTANVTEPRLQLLHSAVRMSDGFAVTWVDHSGADFDDRPDVLFRSFDADGEPETDESSLSPTLEGVQDLPVLASDDAGAIVATYHIPALSPRVRRRTADGEWLDEEPIVLSDERKQVTDVAIGSTHHAFAVVSRAVEERGDVEVVLMDALTGELQNVAVAAAPGVDEVDARIVALPDGAFLLAWTDESHVEDESAEGVLAVRVLAAGTLDGERFVIPNESAGDQILQSLASGPTGTLAVWIDYSHADDQDGAALRGRVLFHEIVEVPE